MKTTLKALKQTTPKIEHSSLDLTDNEFPPILTEEASHYNLYGPIVGWISDFDKQKNVVFVDFDGNPFGRPLQAKLGRPFHLKDLTTAQNRAQEVRLDFENQNLALPIISDIYYSIFDGTLSNQSEELDIHLQGKRVVIEASQEVVIKSGSATTRYMAKGGKIKEQATYISSNAMVSNKIKGGNISLN